jgi:hypothetical protein
MKRSTASSARAGSPRTASRRRITIPSAARWWTTWSPPRCKAVRERGRDHGCHRLHQGSGRGPGRLCAAGPADRQPDAAESRVGITLTHMLNRAAGSSWKPPSCAWREDRFYLVCAAFFEQRLLDHLATTCEAMGGCDRHLRCPTLGRAVAERAAGARCPGPAPMRGSTMPRSAGCRRRRSPSPGTSLGLPHVLCRGAGLGIAHALRRDAGRLHALWAGRARRMGSPITAASP